MKEFIENTQGEKEYMNRLTAMSITALVVIAIVITIDTVKYLKAKKMIDVSIDRCFKAIKEKEVK